MSFSRKSSAFILMTVCLSFLSACGNTDQSASICSSEVLNQKSKIKLHSTPLSLSLKSMQEDHETLPAGTEVVAVIKDECSSEGPISSLIKDRFKGKTPAGVRSYAWKLPETITRSELEKKAEQDFCVIEISDGGETILNQDENLESSPLLLPDDPKVSIQRHLTAIRASQAYDIFYDRKNGIKEDVVIAIIDSGVEINHEDLRGNLWRNSREVAGNGRDDDSNGYVDDFYGYNIASRISSPRPQKTSYNDDWQWAHGTKVAGLAAAVSGNGRGGTGVMGSAKIMAINNMGRDCCMSHADTANAIRYAVDNGAHVINLSQGGFNPASSDLRSAIRYALSKKVVLLAAAGNESTRIDSGYSIAGQASFYLGLLSIGNIAGSTMRKASSSNYSTTYVELGAPGTWSSTTRLFTTDPTSISSYTSFSGTSAATPVAAGAAALAIGLIKSRGYIYTAGDIERLLVNSARKLDSLANYFKNGASLDLYNLAQLINEKYPPRSIDGNTGNTPSPPIEPPGGSGADPSENCD